MGHQEGAASRPPLFACAGPRQTGGGEDAMTYEIGHDDGIRISDDAQRFDIDRAHGWIGGRS